MHKQSLIECPDLGDGADGALGGGDHQVEDVFTEGGAGFNQNSVYIPQAVTYLRECDK